MRASASASASEALDPTAIRRDFPALSLRVGDAPLTYLDNASSAQKPRAVLEALRRSYEEEYANVHRGLHHLSNLATRRFEEARERVAQFLNAESPDEILFVRGATEAINLASRSFGETLRFERGDEIILSILEHHSNIVPWHFWRESRGVVLRWIPCDDEGRLDLDAYETFLSSPRVKMVALTHMSNVLGRSPPIADMIRMARERGVPTLIDGSQSAVHDAIDVRALECDFFAFTGHKLYGPTGIGVLYGRGERLASMPPYQGGGEMVEDVSCESISYGAPPHRFEAGTPPIAEAIGLAAALDYVDGIGRDRIASHESSLLARALDRLSSLEGVTLQGGSSSRDRGSIVSFTLDVAHPHDAATMLDRRGVAVRAGTHCAQPLLSRFGVSATCRASFGLYNTLDEVDVLADAIDEARRFFIRSGGSA